MWLRKHGLSVGAGLLFLAGFGISSLFPAGWIRDATMTIGGAAFGLFFLVVFREALWGVPEDK